MIILITGSTGFVGKRLVNKLHSLGCQLRAISRKPVPGIETFISDFSKSNIPPEALIGVETVFHLAGYTHDMREGDSKKHLYHAINVDATFELAKLAVKNNVKKFIYLSSTKACPMPQLNSCVSEDDTGEPSGIYGRTKREAEIKLLQVARNYMHVSIIRSSLVYGPEAKGNLNLMFSGIKNGWFPPLPRTGNRRSMIHVDDLVRALLFVKDLSKANGEIFIATDGTPHSASDIYDAMCHIQLKPIPKLRVPKFVFSFLAIFNQNLNYKLDKLLGDEYYSSEKLRSFGFSTERTLKEMNETSF